MMAGTRPRWRLWILLAILLLALGLRVYRLDGQSLWADEGNSVALAGRLFATIAQDAALDIHPPLYYFLLRIWTGVFGTSEIGLRSMSALCGVALVAALYLLGRRLLGEAGALLAAMFAAISPFQVYYSQEARMYILMALLAMVMTYAAWRLIELDQEQRPATWLWPAILYVLTAAAGLYTHYFFPFALVTVNLIYLVAWIPRRGNRPGWSRLARWVAIQLAVILLYLPWLGTGVRRLLSWPAGTAGMDPSDWWQAAWNTLCLGPRMNSLWSLTIPFAVLLLLGLWPWKRFRRQSPALTGAGYLLPVLGYALPLIAMGAAGLLSETRLKFLLLSSPFMALILARGGVGLAEWGRDGKVARKVLAWGIAILAVAGIVAPTALALNQYYSDADIARDDYRGMVEYVTAVARPGDAIILSAPGQWDVFSYYYRGEWPVYLLPEQRPPDRASLEGRLSEITATHGRLYVLFWALDEADPEGITESWLDANAFKGVDAWNGNVRFVVYETMAGREGQLVSRDLALTFGSSIQLRSMAMPGEAVSAGDILPISLTWRALSQLADRLKVFIQVLDAGNHLVGQRDAEPGGGASLTTTWAAGDEIVDLHGVFIEPGTPPGEYRLIVGLYNVQDGQRAIVAETGHDFVESGTVQVARPETPLPASVLKPAHAMGEEIGPLILHGFDRHELGQPRDSDAPIAPGAVLHLTFYWQLALPAEGDWLYQVWLDDRMLFDWAPVGGGYGTGQWAAGEIVRDQLDLFLPGDLTSGKYSLRMEVREPAGKNAQWPAPLGVLQVR